MPLKTSVFIASTGLLYTVDVIRVWLPVMQIAHLKDVPVTSDICVPADVPWVCWDCGLVPQQPGPGNASQQSFWYRNQQCNDVDVTSYSAVWQRRLKDDGLIQVSSNMEIDSSSGKSLGMSCVGCHDFNQYGEPNMPNGTFRCFRCRQSWYKGKHS